jgi:hypothetical protein
MGHSGGTTKDAKLQRLENELLPISQKDMTVRHCFSEVKYLCEEILKLDPRHAISEARMRRIVIHGLRLAISLRQPEDEQKSQLLLGWRISWPIKRL